MDLRKPQAQKCHVHRLTDTRFWEDRDPVPNELATMGSIISTYEPLQENLNRKRDWFETLVR